MDDLKTSQRTTRRDIPSARRLLAETPVPDDEDRPSGVHRALAPAAAAKDEEESTAASSR
jgi:hypothetical protein